MTVDYTQFDAETPISGTYVSPTWEREDDETDVAEAIARGFVASVLVVKAMDWSGLSKKWSDRGFREGDLAPVKTSFVTAFRKAALSHLVQAAGLGRQQALMDFEAEFTKEGWRQIAGTWATVYGHEMANQVADQSHKGVAQLVVDLINRGMRGDSLGLQVKGLYGLDPRSMTSAMNFLSRKEKPRNQTILDLASELLTRRAKVIGDVQSFTGLNFGRQLTYLEAMDSGLLARSAKKVWVTAIDERVCKVCRPMDGRTVSLMDTFAIDTSAGTIRLLVPPVHPNCRCTVVPEERYRHGIITRTSRFKEGPRHRASLRSEVEDLVSLGKSASFWEAAKHPRDHTGQFAAEAAGVAGGLAVAGGGTYLAAHHILKPGTLKEIPKLVETLPEDHQFEAIDDWRSGALHRYVHHMQVHGELGPVTTNHTNSESQAAFIAAKEARVRQIINMATHETKPYEGKLHRGFWVSKNPQQTWHSSLGDIAEPGSLFELPVSSFSEDNLIATGFSHRNQNSEGHRVVLHVAPGAHSFVLPNRNFGALDYEHEHLLTGQFRTIRHEMSPYNDFSQEQGVHHIYVEHIPLASSVGKWLIEDVEKFSPLQLRDAVGRFAPLAGVAAGAYVAASNFPKVTNPQPKLPSHLKRVDRKVRQGKNGTYLVPRQYLDFHQRGQSFRLGNEAHINDMAREYRQSGYKMKPVTLHVYDDTVEVADGNHRVEAAYRARLGFVPTKIVHIPGKKPVQRGAIPAWRQSRTNEARRVAASRYVGSLEETRRNPFRNLNQRLIAQDEKKHQWHDKSRKRTIKPL